MTVGSTDGQVSANSSRKTKYVAEERCPIDASMGAKLAATTPA